MKVLIINGSPRVDGNTSRLLKEVTNVFEKEDVEFDLPADVKSQNITVGIRAEKMIYGIKSPIFIILN